VGKARPMRFLPRFAALLLNGAAMIAITATAAPADPAKSVIPADLDGKWLGEVRHEDETAMIGFDFARQSDGRVLTRLWLPNVNAFGSVVGRLEFADRKFSIPGLGSPLILAAGSLSGEVPLGSLKFTARRSDHLPEEPPPPPVATGPEPAWVYHAGAALWTSPVIVDRIAYLGDSGGNFHAVKVDDGRAVWTFNARTPLFGNAAVDREAAYFAGDDGNLFKLDRTSGELRWQADIGGGNVKRYLPSASGSEWDPFAAAPVLAEGTVFMGSADGSLHAIDAATGKPRWQFKSSGKLRAAALVAGDRVYVGSLDHFVYALDRRTGVQRWRFDTGSPITTAPVLAEGKIIIGTRDQSLLFALAADGKKLWTVFYWLSWVESAPTLVDGRLYIGSSDSRRVRAIAPDSGHVDWTAQVWGWTWGTPLVVGDTIYYGTAGAPQYFVTQHASIGALDRATGTLKWRKPLPLVDTSYISGIVGSLGFADHKILAASTDGTLTAYPIP